jgi:gamma-glutamylcyclotransferase (GGCT)/AIG2-like uncharacterized protein YtfP
MKVAVYGSLRQGFHNYGLLENSKYLGTFKTKPVFTMLSLRAFPGLILDGNTSIVIEVYEVDEKVFSRLDSLEGYPSFYNRIQIPVEGIEGSAWIYYLNSKDRRYSEEIVECGDWKEYMDKKEYHKISDFV